MKKSLIVATLLSITAAASFAPGDARWDRSITGTNFRVAGSRFREGLGALARPGLFYDADVSPAHRSSSGLGCLPSWFPCDSTAVS